MDKENIIHYKALLCEIMYVNETKYYFYEMKPDKNINWPWELCGYSETYYAGDNDTGEIVTGYIVLINRDVIAWNSQSHKTVRIYVKESEY